MATRLAARSGWQICSRVLASVVGSYVFTWGFIAFVTACLLHAGLEFHEATHLTLMLGFLVFLAAMCFAFIAASALRVWVILLGAGTSLTFAGWWLARSLA